MNFKPTNSSEKSSVENESDDEFEELINSHQRRNNFKSKGDDLNNLLIFVKLEKHQEKFELDPNPTTTVKEVIDYFHEKNNNKLQRMYPEETLVVLMCKSNGQKKSYPGIFIYIYFI